MRTSVAVLAVLLGSPCLNAAGILIPEEKEVPPLAMLSHRVEVTVNNQVATTRVEQTFRNHTDRNLEATYVFPVPRDANVKSFTMWVNGKKITGEMVEADKARDIYTSIVEQTRDPGLLEYIGHRMFRVRVFPIAPKADQKIAFSYTAVVPKEGNLVHFTYPLKTDGRAIKTLEDFSVRIEMRSKRAIHNIYSPTHPISISRRSDKEAKVSFSKKEAALDRNFDLYWSEGDSDVGITLLPHRPAAGQPGWFLMLVSPSLSLSQRHHVPRDIVFVLDTSGSMRGKRIEQAKNALKYCLRHLNANDRFAVIQFATTINRYSADWRSAAKDEIDQACRWIDGLFPSGGTAINDALLAALRMRTNAKGRTFTIVFFTDGRPTIGERDSDAILKNVLKHNTSNTRIFTFGVGDDVNASMLDQLAEESRAVSTYVRESEDIEEKVSRLYDKIRHPVLTNLALEVTGGIRLTEVYPPKLPDLFHGSQLVVLGRYTGENSNAKVILRGNLGNERQQFEYTVEFPKQTDESFGFVEELWAARKVGYLLDQIRRHGEEKELVDEVVRLAKRYGITTPYTSYLIVPDQPSPVAAKEPVFRGRLGADLPWLTGTKQRELSVVEYARRLQEKGGLEKNRAALEDLRLNSAAPAPGGGAGAFGEAKAKKDALDRARGYIAGKQLGRVQAGKLGVSLSVYNQKLRNCDHLTPSAVKRVNGHVCIEVGGVWVDEAFRADMQTVTVKAMSKAYFALLRKHPELRHVFQLGNHIVYVLPSGKALVIDTVTGRTELSDAEIQRMFAAK